MEPEYKGWIVSNSFLKRCFAIFGHMLVAQLIISIPIYIIMFIVMASVFSGLDTSSVNSMQ